MEKGYKRMRKELDGLFVATMVYDREELIEPYMQYETQGRIDHHVIVTSEKRLVYSVTDETGKTRFYDYKTDEEIDFYEEKSSYITDADPLSTLYHVSKGVRVPLTSLETTIDSYHKKSTSLRYGYPQPFSIYTESILGKPIFCDNPKIASVILNMLPKNKQFELSFDEEESKKQIDKYIYRKK